MPNTYTKTEITGGGTSSLDQIDGSLLSNNDKGFVVTSTYYYIYLLNATSGATANPPNVVSPIINAGDKRWILIKQYDTDVMLKSEYDVNDDGIVDSAATAANLTGSQATAITNNTAHRNITDGNPHGTDANDVNCLAKDNTTSFTPTSDHNPATKKSSEDAVKSIISDLSIGNIQNPLYHLPLKSNIAPRIGSGSVEFIRDSKATHIDRYGNVVDLDVGIPGFDANGIDLPMASTNILTYSRNILMSEWRKNGLTPTSANEITEVVGNEQHYIIQDFSKVATIYTAKVMVSMKNRRYVDVAFSGVGNFNGMPQAKFDLETGTVQNVGDQASAKINTLPDGRKVCVLTSTSINTEASGLSICFSDNDFTRFPTFEGDTTSGGYIWETQVEALPFATPFIPTTDSPVARSSSILQFPYAENFPGSLKDKTIIMDIDVIGTNASSTDAFTSGDLRLLISGSEANDSKMFVSIDSGKDTIPVVAPQSYKYGVSYNFLTTTLKAFINGVNVSEITNANSSRSFISNILIGDSDAYIKVKNLRIYDIPLTENEMRLA